MHRAWQKVCIHNWNTVYLKLLSGDLVLNNQQINTLDEIRWEESFKTKLIQTHWKCHEIVITHRSPSFISYCVSYICYLFKYKAYLNGALFIKFSLLLRHDLEIIKKRYSVIYKLIEWYLIDFIWPTYITACIIRQCSYMVTYHLATTL